MIPAKDLSTEIFSFHLVKLPLLKLPKFLLCPVHKCKIPGLRYSESLLAMSLGEPIVSVRRYEPSTAAFFAWWSAESFLDEFLERPIHRFFGEGWQVRMKLYRRWGEVAELRQAQIASDVAVADKPMVAVTLARLDLLQTPRFIRWGMPVERQVRDLQSQSLALAAIRPFNTFSTFSVWQSESKMVQMVQGSGNLSGGDSHRLAMGARVHKDFHHEFSTMRFAPFKEVGVWNGKSGFAW